MSFTLSQACGEETKLRNSRIYQQDFFRNAGTPLTR